jgi:hypothetical protein
MTSAILRQCLHNQSHKKGILVSFPFFWDLFLSSREMVVVSYSWYECVVPFIHHSLDISPLLLVSLHNICWMFGIAGVRNEEISVLTGSVLPLRIWLVFWPYHQLSWLRSPGFLSRFIEFHYVFLKCATTFSFLFTKMRLLPSRRLPFESGWKEFRNILYWRV